MCAYVCFSPVAFSRRAAMVQYSDGLLITPVISSYYSFILLAAGKLREIICVQLFRHRSYRFCETFSSVLYSGVPRGGGLGCSNPPPLRNSEDIGGVLDRTSKKSRRLDFLLQFTVFSYGCNLLNKGYFQYKLSCSGVSGFGVQTHPDIPKV